jgi:predicted DCC family thiol-disulfide oxidoreductase YuxK
MMPKTEQKPVIVYDGHCNFCIGQINRIIRCDKHNQFETLSRYSDGLFERFPVLKQENLDSGLRVVALDGNVSVGADAVYDIYKKFSPAKYIAWIYKVPILNLLFKMVYTLIAKNRYRFAGKCKDGTCKL